MSKPLSTLLLALTLSLCCVSAFAQGSFGVLKNADILTMVRAKLPPALIIEKINASNCSFDTYPSVLAELKYKGVPDEVLMAMVQAPHGARPRTKVEPEPQAEVKPKENTGGVILHDRTQTPNNACFFVAPMEEGFDGLITALMIEKKLPL